MYEDIKVWQLSTIGLLAVVVIVMAVLLLQVVYYQVAARQSHEKDFSQPPVELSSLVAEQQGRLLEYRVMDPKKKLVAIPIQRAKELVLRELARVEPAQAPEDRPKE